MATLPLVKSDWRRDTAEEPVGKVLNRFFEENPMNLSEGTAMIVRPGLRRWVYLDGSSILGLYSQDGAFDNHLFAIQSNKVRRIRPDGTFTGNLTTAFTDRITSNNRGCFSNAIGAIPSYFFFVREGILDCYCNSPVATASLVFTGTPENNSIVTIGGIYYKFTNATVDTGTPDGSSSSPYLVAIGTFLSDSISNLSKAVNGTGTPGTDYSTATVKNTLANANILTADTIQFYATVGGVVGNSTAVTVSATTVMTWSSSTLVGGSNTGEETKAYPVPLPADESDLFLREIEVNQVVSIGSYVLVTVNSRYNGTSGRFYWINPGETWIDPLSYATAESNPDSIVSIRVVGDKVWFLGRDSIEVWTITGDPFLPFNKIAGLTINFGSLEGTDVTLNNTLIFAEPTGVVYAVNNGLQRISTNSIEERIRVFQQGLNFYNETDIANQFRAWTLQADGHMFYVLSLGRQETLVYDMSTQQWASWANFNSAFFRQHSGVKVFDTVEVDYPDLTLNVSNQTIVGDIDSGRLWVVSPNYRFDDQYNDEEKTFVIQTQITCGVPARMRDTVKCNEIFLTGSIGAPSADMEVFFLKDGDTGAQLTDGEGGPFLYEVDDQFTPQGLLIQGEPTAVVGLEVSDDNGRTWGNMGFVQLVSGQWNTEVVWRSLGVIQAPGRVFRFTDYGSMTRIDGVDMR